MNINAISSSQTISNVVLTHESEATDKDKITTSSEDSPTKKIPNNKYDVHNMSTDDLKNLIHDLRETGQISEEDSLMLSLDRIELEIFGTQSKDTKIDMINFFEQQVEVMNSTPGTKGVEFMERALNLFKMMEAKQGSDIPNKV